MKTIYRSSEPSWAWAWVVLALVLAGALFAL